MDNTRTAQSTPREIQIDFVHRLSTEFDDRFMVTGKTEEVKTGTYALAHIWFQYVYMRAAEMYRLDYMKNLNEAMTLLVKARRLMKHTCVDGDAPSCESCGVELEIDQWIEKE